MGLGVTVVVVLIVIVLIVGVRGGFSCEFRFMFEMSFFFSTCDIL